MRLGTSLPCPQKELFLLDHVHVGHGSLLISGVDVRTMYLNLARTPCSGRTPTGAPGRYPSCTPQRREGDARG